jgi:hypothetical protein
MGTNDDARRSAVLVIRHSGFVISSIPFQQSIFALRD